jgi:hypothetical protein
MRIDHLRNWTRALSKQKRRDVVCFLARKFRRKLAQLRNDFFPRRLRQRRWNFQQNCVGTVDYHGCLCQVCAGGKRSESKHCATPDNGHLLPRRSLQHNNQRRTNAEDKKNTQH